MIKWFLDSFINLTYKKYSKDSLNDWMIFSLIQHILLNICFLHYWNPNLLGYKAHIFKFLFTWEFYFYALSYYKNKTQITQEDFLR